MSKANCTEDIVQKMLENLLSIPDKVFQSQVQLHSNVTQSGINKEKAPPSNPPCENNVQNENLPPGSMYKSAQVSNLTQSYCTNTTGISVELELGVIKQENMMLKARLREFEIRENQHALNAKGMKLEILDLKEKMNSQSESQAVSDRKIQELLSQLAKKEDVEKKISELEKRLAEAEKEKAEQLIKYAGIKQTLDSERKSKNKLEEELTELKETYILETENVKKSLETEVQKVVTLVRSLEAETDGKNALETKLQNVQRTLKSENTELKKALGNKEKRLLKLEKSQFDLEKRTEALKKDFDEKSKHIAEVETKKNAYLAKMIRENNENSKKLVQVKQDFEQTDKEKKELEGKLSKIEKDYELLKDYFKKLQQSKKEKK